MSEAPAPEKKQLSLSQMNILQMAYKSADDAGRAKLDRALPKLQEHFDIPSGVFSGFTPDNPSESDIFAGPTGDNPHPHAWRMATSYGNPEGNAEKMKALGYKDARTNKNGDLVVQLPNGNWVKDAPGLLHGAESHLGKALPMLGGAFGALAGPGTSVALQAGGEALRAATGTAQGFYKPTLPGVVNDLAGEGVSAAGGQAAGQLISKIPGAKLAAETAIEAGRKTISGATSMATGVPYESVERLLQTPFAVSNPLTNLQIAKRGEEELKSSMGTTTPKFEKSLTHFHDVFGKTPVDTSDEIAILRHMEGLPKNSAGFGYTNPEERQAAEDLIQNHLTSPEFSIAQPKPGNTSFKPVWGETQSMPPEYPGAYTPVQTQSVPQPPQMTGGQSYGAGGNPYGSTARNNSVPYSPLQMKVVPAGPVQPQVTPLSGYESRMPYTTAGELQPTAVDLSRGVSYPQTPSTRVPLPESQNKLVAGSIKKKLYNIDPAFGEANETFSQAKQDAETLKAWRNQKQQERYSGTLFGKNKSAEYAAAERQTPGTYQDMKDRGAYNDFGGFFVGPPGDKGYFPTSIAGLVKPAMLLGNAAGVTGYYGKGGQSPWPALLSGGLALSTSPRMAYQTLTPLAKMMGPIAGQIRQNPGLLPGFALDQGANELWKKYSPWGDNAPKK